MKEAAGFYRAKIGTRTVEQYIEEGERSYNLKSFKASIVIVVGTIA